MLATGGTLHVFNVSGCAGLINSGDATQFSGTYTVTPGADHHLPVTSTTGR